MKPAATVALYATTIFSSAALLFVVQPMFARMVLPLLGGSPATWNTTMVFYQLVLLVGYAYAHLSTSRLGVKRQSTLHLLVLLLPLAFMPIAIPAGWHPPVQSNPIPWLLTLMLCTVGLPFFAISTTSPMIQRWFASTNHRRAADPYFLYAASNAGSMLALVAYPVWIEPHLHLETQSRYWFCGYCALLLLTTACAVRVWIAPAPVLPATAPTASTDAGGENPSFSRRLRWVMLAFVPSSLMLSVTTYISSEVAAIPLLWIIPLCLYLLTFILAFARRQILPFTLLVRALPILLIPLVMVLNMQATRPIGMLLLLHLAAFFSAAMLCHAKLAADRPGAAHVTEFYLWLSVGGALGGIFTALLAPLIFHSVMEYPLMLVLACLVALNPRTDVINFRLPVKDWLWPLLLGLFALVLLWLVRASRFSDDTTFAGIIFGVPALICYFFSRHPRRFALGVGVILLVGGLYDGAKGGVLCVERSFFGVHRVTLDETGQYHQLVHGTTLHGKQALSPARSHEALSYYYRTGPIGQVFALYGRNAGEKIALVGLGGGTLASYAVAGQSWTAFELDPMVVRLARDDRYFTFLRDAAVPVNVVLGDARLSLAKESDHQYNLIVLDAYSSDAVPMHLVTREALALYLGKLAPGGLLAFHISNQHLDLEPVFANLAHDAGLTCLTRDDTQVSPEELALGKSPSVWLVMTRQAQDQEKLASDSRWQNSRRNDQQAVWTDNYSSLLSVFRWH